MEIGNCSLNRPHVSSPQPLENSQCETRIIEILASSYQIGISVPCWILTHSSFNSCSLEGLLVCFLPETFEFNKTAHCH